MHECSMTLISTLVVIRLSLITKKLFGNCAIEMIQNIGINIVYSLQEGYSHNSLVINQALIRESSKKSLRQWNIILHRNFTECNIMNILDANHYFHDPILSLNKREWIKDKSKNLRVA